MKLISLNISIKLDNAHQVAEFLRVQQADIVLLQEVVNNLDEAVFPMYQSKKIIEEATVDTLPYRFFGSLRYAEASMVDGKIRRNFGGMVEQGNEILSAYPFTNTSNEHYYKSYEYSSDRTNFATEDHPRAVQVATCTIDGKSLQLLNLHGLRSEGKLGDERTLAQCTYVLEAALRKKTPTIIAGDFNLLPDNAGIQLLSGEFRNLIDEFHITSTRPDFTDTLESGGNVVDYIFVNEMIDVKRFEVIDTTISDHLPLLLEFEIK
ncbi:endonuclease/exonuclease/phosphatase family protein [Patescibacteria group bacterium]|nr:endonuclease/exonuclease/phosphatase family protein [Patescibacteria group bacterium]